MTWTSSKLRQYLDAVRPRHLSARLTGPRVLLASVPKAGTNLLMRVLELFPQLIFAGIAVGPPARKAELLGAIAELKRGRFLVTHYGFSDVASIVQAQDIVGVFLIRDPRDTCLSWYHYIMREPAHWCHTYFRSVLDHHSCRLMAAIEGLTKDQECGRPFLPSIDQHFRIRMDYIDQPRFCTVRFEDLVGSAGGGNDDRQEQSLRAIAEHLALPLRKRDLRRIMAHAFSPRSPTFRKGQIGTWREELAPEHKAAFKDVAGALLIELGYEDSMDW